MSNVIEDLILINLLCVEMKNIFFFYILMKYKEIIRFIYDLPKCKYQN